MTTESFETKDPSEQIRTLQIELIKDCEEYITETTEHTYQGQETKSIVMLGNGVVIETQRSVVVNYNTEFEVERQQRSVKLLGRELVPRTTYTLTDRITSISGKPPDCSSFDKFSFVVGRYELPHLNAYKNFGERLQKWLQFERKRKAK